jgi:hypothetical protein
MAFKSILPDIILYEYASHEKYSIAEVFCGETLANLKLINCVIFLQLNLYCQRTLVFKYPYKF